ncbi:STAS domain-containing protein [candidate division KSB1 bacterium]|nr:STAS domain-containing protein [candidate division KSB1 bacterium]
MHSKEFEPKLIAVLREGVSFAQLSKDLAAGVTVGLVAIPLAIAFAIASGVRPEQGLYTAIIAGFTISLLSGSRVQIGGPTGAFVILVHSIVTNYGMDGLAFATIVAGILLVAMGMARLGTIIRFIPYPVTVGFTTGIALIIATGQLFDGMGIYGSEIPSPFHLKWLFILRSLPSIDFRACAICLLTIAIMTYWPRVTKRLPGSLVALVLTTIAVELFSLPIDTIASRFGEIPNMLPRFHWPMMPTGRMAELFSAALSIALLGGIESLLSAVVADGMTGRRHRSNMELIAQGAANLISPLFGGIPATGAIARTATNIKNGGLTPFAGLFHALTVLMILLFAGRWAALIPMPALAGILLVVAWNMSELHLFFKIFKSTRSDSLVLLTTFLLTLFIDLTVAIQAGVVLASVLLMRRMASVTQMRFMSTMLNEEDPDNPGSRTLDIPPGTEIFEINGTFFFGAAHKFRDALLQINRQPQILILRMRNVLALDATGLNALEALIDQSQKNGTTVLLSGVHAQPFIVMERSGFLQSIKLDNVLGTFQEALQRAHRLQAEKQRVSPSNG